MFSFFIFFRRYNSSILFIQQNLLPMSLNVYFLCFIVSDNFYFLVLKKSIMKGKITKNNHSNVTYGRKYLGGCMQKLDEWNSILVSKLQTIWKYWRKLVIQVCNPLGVVVHTCNPVLRRLRLEDCGKFKAVLGYVRQFKVSLHSS